MTNFAVTESTTTTNSMTTNTTDMANVPATPVVNIWKIRMEQQQEILAQKKLADQKKQAEDRKLKQASREKLKKNQLKDQQQQQQREDDGTSDGFVKVVGRSQKRNQTNHSTLSSLSNSCHQSGKKNKDSKKKSKSSRQQNSSNHNTSSPVVHSTEEKENMKVPIPSIPISSTSLSVTDSSSTNHPASMSSSSGSDDNKSRETKPNDKSYSVNNTLAMPKTNSRNSEIGSPVKIVQVKAHSENVEDKKPSRSRKRHQDDLKSETWPTLAGNTSGPQKPIVTSSISSHDSESVLSKQPSMKLPWSKVIASSLASSDDQQYNLNEQEDMKADEVKLQLSNNEKDEETVSKAMGDLKSITAKTDANDSVSQKNENKLINSTINSNSSTFSSETGDKKEEESCQAIVGNVNNLSINENTPSVAPAAEPKVAQKAILNSSSTTLSSDNNSDNVSKSSKVQKSSASNTNTVTTQHKPSKLTAKISSEAESNLGMSRSMSSETRSVIQNEGRSHRVRSSSYASSAPDQHQNGHHQMSHDRQHYSSRGGRGTRGRGSSNRGGFYRPHSQYQSSFSRNYTNTGMHTRTFTQQTPYTAFYPSVYVQPTDADLETILYWIRNQIEYYFSIENLCRDLFIRQNMRKEDGGVPATLIISFNRVKALLTMAHQKTNNSRATKTDMEVVKMALSQSDSLEMKEDHIKLKQGWEYWIPSAQMPVITKTSSSGKSINNFSNDVELTTASHVSSGEVDVQITAQNPSTNSVRQPFRVGPFQCEGQGVIEAQQQTNIGLLTPETSPQSNKLSVDSETNDFSTSRSRETENSTSLNTSNSHSLHFKKERKPVPPAIQTHTLGLLSRQLLRSDLMNVPTPPNSPVNPTQYSKHGSTIGPSQLSSANNLINDLTNELSLRLSQGPMSSPRHLSSYVDSMSPSLSTSSTSLPVVLSQGLNSHPASH